MKSLGFKKTIIISIIILVTLCLLTSNWIAYNNLKEQTIQGISEHSKTVVDYEAKKVETWFAARITVIKSLANRYEKQTHSNDQAHHDDYISTTKLTKKIGQLSDIFLGFADGSMYGSATGDGWTDGVANPEEFDPRTRPWYKQAKSTNTAVLTDIYSDAFTGNPIISIAKDFGNGVVVGDVSLSILIDTVKDINFPGAISIIFDQTGTALASSSSAAVKIGDKLSSIGLGKLQSTILSQDESSLSYTLDGIDKVAFTKTINLTDGKKWYLFIGVDKSVVYAQIDQALNDAIISSLIMLLIAISLVIFILHRLYRPILSLKEMVIDLSKGNGDLTRRLPVESNDELGEISQGINQFIANLQSLMLEISQTSEHISNSVEQLQQQTDANNQVLTAHSMETEQVVSAIEEMSATAKDVAGNASEASQFTHDTNEQVSESLSVVTNATNTVSQLVGDVENTAISIEDIGKDTQEITTVLNVIGAIAEQTNLLALNAAIEAARAGEQGRGFAVVADEVRALAARTQSSTAEIEATLNKLLNASQMAIKAMNDTKSTCEKTTQGTSLVATDLNNIASSVNNIDDLNTLIATAAEQQSSVTQDITRNMSAIREMVEELAINGQTTANEATSLSAANNQLRAVVGKFKLQ